MKKVPFPKITLEEMKAMYPNSQQMFEERKPDAERLPYGVTPEELKAMYPNSPPMDLTKK